MSDELDQLAINTIRTQSERIGTALINGAWLVRRLQPLAGRAVVMHGHRRVDWVGECAGLRIVSAPSPLMVAKGHNPTCFYIHRLAVGADRRLKLLQPERIVIAHSPDPAARQDVERQTAPSG